MLMMLAVWFGFSSVHGAITVRTSGPGGSAQQTLPDTGGSFDLNLPLTANAVNQITVSATDAATNQVEKVINITQLSLDKIVVSQVTTERLPPERVVELVNQGVINVEDPENFNVSTFNIVLTIGGQRVPISTPIVTPISEPSGFEIIRPMSDPGSGGGNTPRIQDTEIVVFEVTPPSPPGIPAPRIYGVIVMEGRIKSLKEFYSVRLLLMNTSGIFTLKDVLAQLTFPDGGLSHTLPSDGFISFGDILPGDGGEPGQKEREFIIRGDEIGVRKVRIDFGGTVAGPGLPEEDPIAFNGTAESSVEVKGPPSFLVTVIHPPQVFTNTPYDLIIEIQNTGELPALYASLDLEVGADALIEQCTYQTNVADVVCVFSNGPVTRAFGHIYPGEKVRETYRLMPLKEGPITSCLGISDQNIQLQVAVGNIGCLVGQYPPTLGVPEGLPVVSVVPVPNQLGVSPTAPVSAFFSELMNESTITTGPDGTFNVFDPTGSIVTGGVRFVTIGNRTVAIWQRDSGFNILDDNTKYDVVLTSGIRDLEGNALFNPWQSSFRTTSLINDQDPPELTMTILPPVDPNFVLPGQLVQVNAYASDQGTGIRRVELFIKSLDDTNALYELIDQKTVFDPLSTLEPSVFTIDSSQLVPGQTYQLLGTAYDVAGNARDSTLAFILAASAAPPVITLPADPTNFVLRGVSVPLTPTSVSGGVRQVQYFLDGATNAFASVFLAPWQTTLRTLDLAIGIHTVKAVAVDALMQTGEDNVVFELVENLNEPQVGFGATISGAQYVTGTTVSVLGFVDDPTGVKSVRFFLNDLNSPPVATNLTPFQLSTTGLSTGTYRIILLASNNLNIANNPLDPKSYLEFTLVASPPGPPPAAPTVTSLSDPDDGTTTVIGNSVPGAIVSIVNTNLGAAQNVTVASNGVFTGVISATGGDGLRLTAFHAPTSPSNSAPAFATVPVPPAVTNLLISPSSRTFTAAGQFQDFTVTAQLLGGGSSNVTARSSFSSSSSAIASVNQAGRMVAQNNGIANLTATFKTNTAQAAITVDIVVITNFLVSVSKPLLVFPGDTAQITVTGQYSNGTSAPIFSGISYGAANPSVATVNGAGTISAAGSGTAAVSVAAGALPPKNVSVTVNFALNPPPATTILSPANGAAVERGQFVSVNVQANDPTGGVVRTEFRTSGTLISSNSAAYSVRSSDTRAFSFSVPTNANIGSTITVSVWSVDVGAMVSPTSSITLNVSDLTAPSVAITLPTNGTPFNSLQTVTVAVAASDAVGVKQVRFETEDAFVFSGVSNIVPSASPVTVPFSFVLPPNPPSSSLVVRAFASDLAGNTRTSAPITLIMTDADITPPETIITSATAGTSNSMVVLNYSVTEGLADLAQVGIYYRRNGIGTFNRWTEPDGTNVLGRYLPASGSNGVVVFNATKMGGDGMYEFYSVGVDTRGNRELLPVLPDQTFNVAPFFTWTTVTSGTFISAIDGNYEDLNLRLSNAFVVIEGAHTVRNIDLLGTSRITHASTTTSNEPQFNITAWTISVASNASIDVTGRGYLGGRQGDNISNNGRTTNNASGSTVRSAGSYGGIGGIVGGTPNALYGSVVTPIDLGSGGSSDGGATWLGGNGGGRIAINAINIAADGPIRANGNPNVGNNSGSGSGGSLYLITRTLSGNGWVEANGGANEVGGGGGRVAVHHIDIATKDTAQIRALGGDGSNADGGNGTVFLLDFGSSNSTLVVDGQGVSSPFSSLPIPVGFTFDNIIIRNNARVIVDDLIVVNDSLRIETGSILTHSVTQTNGVRITAARVFVDGTSAIDVTGKGCRGGWRDGNPSAQGETLDGQVGASARAGGSYGGLGGIFSGPGNNLVYGSLYDPVYLGAGGSSDGGSFWLGGNGGGRITIIASDRVTVHGSLKAEGQTAAGNSAGSGAGGSIKITSGLFEGSGSVSANGGGFETAGGGGRILVNYGFIGSGTNDFSGLRNVTASGGKGTQRNGSAGTVLFKQTGQAYGDLYIDATVTNTTANIWSPLTPIGLGRSVSLTTNTLTADGQVPLLPGGLVGLTLRPNVNAATSFTIISNSTNTITVQVSGGTNLTTVAAPGDVYAADYRFDNVILRRGAWLVMSDKLVVGGSLSLTENSVLTHFDAKVAYEPGLDISANSIVISSNSAINVDGRGYLGGRQDNNVSNNGRTVSNAPGSTARSAGSHGGIGGSVGGTANPTYGDIKTPVELGSGGSSDGGATWLGGDGGGRMRLTAASMTIDGAISANGDNNLGNQSGSGSGGSILLDVGTVTGSGIVRANGGTNEVGGGGGRVAIYYASLGMNSSQFRALGGDGSSSDGGHGTVFLKSSVQANGELIVDGGNQASPPDSVVLPAGFTFDTITIRNMANVLADSPIVVADALNLLSGSRLSHTRGLESGIIIQAARVFVDGTSSIDVTGKGYRGGRRDGNVSNNGETLGGQAGANIRSGGSYGGLGGIFNGSGDNLAYGSPYDPIYLGAGGSSDGGATWIGGNGGGRITIIATNRVTVHGSIKAEGQVAVGNGSGSGSGGSIKITTGLFEGSGSVSANGGGFETGGGGGRILVNYDTLGTDTNGFDGLRNVIAAGGKGVARQGSAGTVLFKQTSQAYGDLYLDATLTNTTAGIWSPLTPIGLGRSVALTTNTLTVDGEVPLLPGGLVGVQLLPNVNQPISFTIVSNSANTITVLVSGGTNLTDVANAGDLYAAAYRFDNVVLRRGAMLVTSDKVTVDGTLSITENSMITHYDAKVAYEPGLDLVANNIVLSSNSTINADGRGYLGGRQGDNSSNFGRTVSNALGSSVRSAGSHGGLGGTFGGTANAIYGDLKYPVELGSGGSSDGGATWLGADGGGRVKLTAATMTLDGVISANGNNGTGNQSGSGSGGSILLDAGTLSGVGTVRANGGSLELGGGGGRVAVHYATLTMTSTQFRTVGGDGSVSDGGHGTVFFKSSTQTNGDLIVDGFGFATASDSTPMPSNVVFDSIVFRNGARILLTDTLVAQGPVQVISNSVLSHPLSWEPGLRIEANSLLIDGNSFIDASARGYRGGRRDGNASALGLTTNETLGSTVRSGGSYGGLGNAFSGTPNPVYGTATNPVHLGSGGSSDGGSTWIGGHGGGRITLVISGLLTNDGTIRVNGGAAAGNQAGGGSGGAIKISAGTLAGTGIISANGGGNEVAGGGGRIAIYAANLQVSTNSLTVNTGFGAFAGQAGSVVIQTLPPPPGVFNIPSPTTTPTLQAAQVTSNSMIIVWDVEGDGPYLIQFSPDLMPSAWTTLQQIITPVWTGALPVESDKGFWRIIED